MKVGTGSFGSIFRALDLVTNQYVAVKIEKKAHQKKPSQLANMIEWEVQILTILDHEDGFPCLFKHGRIQDYNWMAISLLGINLEQLNKRNGKKGLSIDLSIQIGIQILKRIEKLHEYGYLHRDIKPENFLLNKDYP